MCSSAVVLYCTYRMVHTDISYIGALRGSLLPNNKFCQTLFILDSERAVSVLPILWSVPYDTRMSPFSWHSADREHTTTQWGNHMSLSCLCSRLRLKWDGRSAETRFRLSAKRTSFQLTTGRRAVHISLQGLYFSCKPVFCSHVTRTGYPLHSLVSTSLLLLCVTVCHHISSGLYELGISACCKTILICVLTRLYFLRHRLLFQYLHNICELTNCPSFCSNLLFIETLCPLECIVMNCDKEDDW
jgi:hypothetical protein